MKRAIQFLICAGCGIGMLTSGLLVPAHLRAVDDSIIERAGRNTTSLVDHARALLDEKKHGEARQLWQAARIERLPGHEELGAAMTNWTAQSPEGPPRVAAWNAATELLEPSGPSSSVSNPFTEFIIKQDNRNRSLDLLQSSSNVAVQSLLRCRALTNTAIFPPSSSASGQAFDAALSIAALLLVNGHISTGLSNRLSTLAGNAGHEVNSESLEEILIDLMSLGQKLDWNQLGAFVGRVEDAAVLHRLAEQIRRADETQLAAIFSAVILSGRPGLVAEYLTAYSQTGLKDLCTSLRYGAGGVGELIKRQQRLHVPVFRQRLGGLAVLGPFLDFSFDYSWTSPWMALMLKWFLYLAGGFLLAAALHFARPAATALERPLQVRGFHLARETLFALGFLLVVLLLSEPFLSQDSQRVESTLRLRLPTVGGAVPAGINAITRPLMNQLSLLTLLLFFVLQALIYTSCLVKLAEIRRQRVASRLKLKLLDNEEHLFDAGLYLGFVGTIISLILVSLGVIKPSLMAAYSSTSFGIIFVSVFKIFHLRPLRRKLLLEAEAAAAQAAAAPAEHTLATSL